MFTPIKQSRHAKDSLLRRGFTRNPVSLYFSCAFDESAHQADVVGVGGSQGELRLDCEEPRREATEIPLCERHGAMVGHVRVQVHKLAQMQLRVSKGPNLWKQYPSASTIAGNGECSQCSFLEHFLILKFPSLLSPTPIFKEVADLPS